MIKRDKEPTENEVFQIKKKQKKKLKNKPPDQTHKLWKYIKQSVKPILINTDEKRSISKLSNKIYEYCNSNQRYVLKIVKKCLIVFILAIVFKSITQNLACYTTWASRYSNNFWVILLNIVTIACSFLVDFATLSLVIVTLMFTAQNNYDTDNTLGDIFKNLKENGDLYKSFLTDSKNNLPSNQTVELSSNSDSNIKIDNAGKNIEDGIAVDIEIETDINDKKIK